MDLKKRKLQFIQEFFQLKSEDAISRFEQLLKEEKEKDEHNFEPMEIEEFNLRIWRSLEDSKQGRITETKDLLAQIKKWS